MDGNMYLSLRRFSMIKIGRLKNMSFIKMVLFSLIMITMGCSRSNKTPSITPESRSSIRFAITTKNQALSLNEAEYVINSVRVIAFDNGKIDAFYFANELNITNGETIVELKVKEINDKVVCVILNEPSRLTTRLNEIKFLRELEVVEYKFADYFNEISNNITEAYSYGDAGIENTTFEYNNLPMSGKIVVNPLYSLDYDIKVGRALARVDIWLKSAVENSTFSLTASSTIEYNTCYDGLLIDVASAYPTPTLIKKTLNAKALTLSTTEYKRAFTLYTPERQSSGSQRLEFTITDVSSGNNTIQDLLSFSLDTDEVIKRNYLYTVKCNITRTAVASFLYEVEPWGLKTINVPNFE